MTVTLEQLKDAVDGCGGTVESAQGLGGQLIKAPSAPDLFGMLSELTQLGLGDEHIQIWGGRTAWIHPDGIWV